MPECAHSIVERELPTFLGEGGPILHGPPICWDTHMAKVQMGNDVNRFISTGLHMLLPMARSPVLHEECLLS